MAQKLRGSQTEKNFAKAQTPKPPGMTPSQWESTTGNKLLSYGTDASGKLMTGNMSYMRKDLWDSQKKERQNQIDAMQFKAPEMSSQPTPTQLDQAQSRRSYSSQLSPTLLDQAQSGRSYSSQLSPTQTEQSFEKMGLGSIGGLGGRMGQLEQASMRLGQAASNRRMGETQQEYGLKSGLLGQEYGLRDTSTAKEYGLKGGLLGQEYGLRGALASQEAALKRGLLGQEYVLRGNLAQRESDISSSSAARLGGYSSVQDMSSSISSAREDAERKDKEAEDTARRLSQGQYQVGGRWMLGPGQR